MGDPGNDFAEHFDDDLRDEDPDEFDPTLDCHLGHDGQCGAAGSEWCDFECPMRHSDLFVGSKAWRAKYRGAK